MKTYTRRSALGLAAALALASLAACQSTNPPVDGVADPDGPSVEVTADDPKAAAFQGGAMAFGFSMLAAALAESKRAAVVSPLSISQCLALIAQGSAGQTEAQFAAAFGCEDAGGLRDGANADLVAIESLQKATFDMANTSFFDDSFTVKGDYSTTVQDYFGVAPHTVDFAEADAARDTINAWVEERTNGKIPELIDDGQITGDTRAVLVNALYLKAKWQKPFRPTGDTFEFTVEDGETKDVDYMGDQRVVEVAEVGDSIVFALPYEDEGLEALFWLPPEGESLADVVAALDSAAPEDHPLLATRYERTANLSIPLFEVRQRIELTDALGTVGIVDAFDPDRADFSAIADEPTVLGFVQHEAWLKVAEEGTEGAAATAGGQEAGAAPPSGEPISIELNRPFIFAVQERTTGAIAFLSAIRDPESA